MIRLEAPASSANLGPGFDTLGIALSVYNRWYAELSEEDRLENVEARYDNSDNLFLQAYRYGCAAIGAEDHIRVIFDCEIPSTRGMGSSAAFITAGVAAASLLHDNALDKEEIYQLTAKMEGHPDNTSPCLLGGMVASLKTEDGTYLHRQIPVDESWRFTLLIPDYEVDTKEARAALPASYSRADAARSVANAILNVEALRSGDLELFREASRDVIHEPYRAALIHGFEAVRGIAEDDTGGRLLISGSGPSCLLIAKQYLSPEACGKISALSADWQFRRVTPASGGLLVNGEPL